MVRIGQAEDAFGGQSPKGEASDGSKADFKLLGLNNEKMPSTKRSEWGRAVWGHLRRSVLNKLCLRCSFAAPTEAPRGQLET